MLPERVEKLRIEYTDQYVVVEGDQPSLARFKGKVGQVRTINVNGRALVEFDDNRGRYDVELDYLKVVDKPKPKAPPAAKEKAPLAKPTPAKVNEEEAAPKEKLSELELARQQKEKEEAEKPKPTATSADGTADSGEKP